MTAIARLYTGPELADMQQARPQCELDWRLMQALATTIRWVGAPSTRCTVCDQPLNQSAVYWVVLLPSDPDLGLGMSGGVCGNCGALPRASLQEHAENVAKLLFEDVGGHA